MCAIQAVSRPRNAKTPFALRRVVGATLLWIVVGCAHAELPPAVVSLFSFSASQGWILNGPEFLARAGASIAGVCDINADGNFDILVGATGAGPSDQGMGFVVYGTAAGTTPPASLNDAGFRMTGELSGDEAGASIACAGDVNGDDVDDLLIGAPFTPASGFGSPPGRVYLVYGNESLPSAISLAALNGITGIRIDGVVSGQRLGATLAGGADLNGDRYNDILLSGPNHVAGASNPGQGFVIFGSATLPASFALNTLNGSNGFALNSSDVTTLSLGTAVAFGDLNGDNYPDAILGAPGAAPGNIPGAGSVFVVYGHAGAFPAQIDINTLNGVNGFAIHNSVPAGAAGGSLSLVPDFNGDQRADLVVGAPGAANNSSVFGRGYVVFGASSFPTNFALSGLNGANGFALTSPVAGDVLGRRVAGLHDVNGDGLGEVLFGAPGGDIPATDAGGAYVVYGRRSGLPANLALATLDGSNGFRIQGAVGTDFAGQTVGRVSDLNRDGFADLLVGAPEVDPNNITSAGRVYVIFGDDLIYRDGFN